jgi:hypothetical protein
MPATTSNRNWGAAGEAGFGDLLRGDAEEEDHEDVVDQEVKRGGVPEDLEIAEGLPVDGVLVPLGEQVGREQGDDHAADERNRELLQEVHETSVRPLGHRGSPL